MKSTITLSTLIGVLALGVLVFGGSDASAASITINPGADVANAAAQLNDGDILSFNAGVYPMDNLIDLMGKKNVTLVGLGNVVLEYSGAGGNGNAGLQQAIELNEAQNVVLSNFTLSATNTAHEIVWSTASSGIEIIDSCNITMNGLNINGFGKAGVTVVPSESSGNYGVGCAAGNLAFSNMIFSNDTYGIMFAKVLASEDAGVTGVSFDGKTVMTGVNYGIATNDQLGVAVLPFANAITGVGGGALVLGTVDITASVKAVSLGTNALSVNSDSKINGKLVSEMTDAELKALLGDYASVVKIASEGPALGAPNTGVMTVGGLSVSSNAIAMILSVAAIVAGFVVVMIRKLAQRRRISRLGLRR